MSVTLRPITFVLVVGLAFGCADRRVASTTSPADTAAQVLWMPVEARVEADAAQPVRVKDGRSIYADGSGAVAFTIVTDPAALSARIVEHFATAGWRQRSRQYLNPKLPTSFDLGWQTRCACIRVLDAEGSPIRRQPYHEWRGEWESERGDIVYYALGGEGEQMRGYGAYVPRAVVAAVLGKQGRFGR